MGQATPPASGDYLAGPSHVLPTGGTARFSSPLGVNTFMKATSVVGLTRSMSEVDGSAACTIALAEGFDAHCRSIELRLEAKE